MHLTEEVLINPVTGSENDHLERIPQQFIDHVFDQIQALMRDQAADHTDQRQLCRLRKVQPFLQRPFVLRLAGRILRGKMAVNLRIGFGIVLVGIDAIEDSRKLPLPQTQDGVEAMGIPGIQDLPCIGRADCRHTVGGFDRPFHQVDTAVLFHNGAGRLGNTKHILQDLHPVFALILDIMDGEYGFDVLISLLPGIEQGVVNRNKCALPIVCMDNIRLKIDVPDHFNNGAGKKGEPLGVVIVAVQPRPFEIVLIIQKVIDHTVVLGLEHPAVLAAPRNRHRKTGQKRHRLPQLLRHRFIERQDHTAAHQTDPQGLGKRTRDIRQPTRGGKGLGFAGRVQHFHPISSFSCVPGGNQTTAPLLMNTG